MTALIPGLHYSIGERLTREGEAIYLFTCRPCGETIQAGAVLVAQDLMEQHWLSNHQRLIS